MSLKDIADKDLFDRWNQLALVYKEGMEGFRNKLLEMSKVYRELELIQEEISVRNLKTEVDNKEWLTEMKKIF